MKKMYINVVLKENLEDKLRDKVISLGGAANSRPRKCYIILDNILKRKANWFGQILSRAPLL